MGKEKPKKKGKPRLVFVDDADFEFLSLALRVVKEEKKAPTSLLQRRMKLSYAKAARLVDQLRDIGAIDGDFKISKNPPTLMVKPPTKLEEKPKKKMGKPPIYSKTMADEICDRIAGGESVRQICRDEHMPSAKCVYLWLLDDEKKYFLEKYEKARVIQADAFHDEIFDIADDGSNDWQERELDSGRVIELPNHEYINRSKLRVDARKWAISRMNPRKYGDKLDLTSGGKEIKQPRPVVMNYIIPKEAKTT